MRRLSLALCGLIAIGAGLPASATQEPCRAPAPPVSVEPNIFSPAQENDLGDAIAERLESSFRVIEDDSLTSHLRTIGHRLVSHLPPTSLRIEFHLIDLPEANAFVLPGGRVYVSRKFIAFTRTEDELANVLGHELGHLVARQQTIALTRQLKEVLGITEVGDRADILAKYDRLMDNAARKPRAFRQAAHGSRDQIEADRLGLMVVAAAGYDPAAHVALYDRFSETKGDTGSAFSRLFGTTSPESRRLGELMKGAAALAATCATSSSAGRDDVFQPWRMAVISAPGAGRQESLRGVVSQTKLPPLRSEIQHVRFSPDGRHALAQDAAGISVLTRDPLAVVFRIDTADAEPAQFSVDSTHVMVHTTDLRIERWSVAGRRLAAVHDLVRRSECLTTQLAPDGRTLACVDAAGDLWLIDAETGSPVFQKKSFYRLDYNDLLFSFMKSAMNARSPGGLTLRFSSDGRFFVASYTAYTGSGVVAYDVAGRAPIALKDNARRLLGASFTFAGPDRLVGLDPGEPRKSGLIRLPSGDVEQITLPVGLLDAPTQTGVVFVRPYGNSAIGILNLATRAIVGGDMTEAVDVYGPDFLAERAPGELGLYALEGAKLRASVSLPATRLPRLRTAAVSADFEWLAVSERTRGVLWHVTTGQRAAVVRDFDGGFLDEGGVLFADMPKAGVEPRSITRLDGPARQLTRVGAVTEAAAAQYGRWLIVTRGFPANRYPVEGLEIEVRDVRRPERLWTKAYPRHAPHEVWATADSDAVVVTWVADSPEGRERIRLDPELRNRAKLGDIVGDYVLEVLDMATGHVRGRMLVETGQGSFHLDGVLTAEDLVFLTDSIGRILIYSLATGELQGHAFGDGPVVNTEGGILVVSTGGGRLALYDVKTLARRGELTFAHEVLLKALSPDGQRLFVLTADQTAHVLSVAK